MATFGNLTPICGEPTIPGSGNDFFVTCTCEMNGDPPTRAQNGGTTPGDTKILDAPFEAQKSLSLRRERLGN